jgi:hypothetical protein
MCRVPWGYCETAELGSRLEQEEGVGGGGCDGQKSSEPFTVRENCAERQEVKWGDPGVVRGFQSRLESFRTTSANAIVGTDRSALE